MNTKLISGTALVLASTLAACQTGADGAPSGFCRPRAAEGLTGMDRLTDQKAMQKTGARVVRQIAPGQGVTLDYRRERVTIETDPATGKIVRAACG